MSLFQAMRDADIAQEITDATELVILAAPGVSPKVADALCGAAGRIGAASVIAILDATADTARLGYGRFESVDRLMSAGIDCRMEHGLRQALLIVDNRGWAFTLPAELVEAENDSEANAPNALEMTRSQVLALRGELPQPNARQPAASSESAGSSQLSLSVGRQKISATDVEAAKTDLQRAPAQPFDLSRQVLVYRSFIRFVELVTEGWNLHTRTVKLPKELPVLASGDVDIAKRINATMKVLEDIQTSRLRELGKRVDELRKDFCKPVKKLGRICLRANEPTLKERVGALADQLAEIRAGLEKEITEQLDRTKVALTGELAKRVLKHPPDAFIGGFAQTLEGAKAYVRKLLDRAFPSAADLIQSMTLSLRFKDVTYEMLQEPGFQSEVFKHFDRSALPQGLADEYDAARKKQTAQGQLL